MVKEFGCEQCGHILKAVPPDDFHTVFSINKIKDDCKETVYKCDDCEKEIIRYWCTKDLQLTVSTSYKSELLKNIPGITDKYGNIKG